MAMGNGLRGNGYVSWLSMVVVVALCNAGQGPAPIVNGQMDMLKTIEGSI